jgi:hypothetical protein
MNIKIDLDLSAEELKQLAGILGAKSSELSNRLQPFVKAAAQEYVQMFLGQKVFTRGSDTREFRLFLLIHEAFDNKIPDEQQVCDLFQCSTTQARALIRAVMSKYQYDLQEAIVGTIKDRIKHVTEGDGDTWAVIINNENVVDAMNRDLASIDGSLPQVARKKNTVSTYELKNSSYVKLCKHYDLEPRALPHE